MVSFSFYILPISAQSPTPAKLGWDSLNLTTDWIYNPSTQDITFEWSTWVDLLEFFYLIYSSSWLVNNLFMACLIPLFMIGFMMFSRFSYDLFIICSQLLNHFVHDLIMIRSWLHTCLWHPFNLFITYALLVTTSHENF